MYSMNKQRERHMSGGEHSEHSDSAHHDKQASEHHGGGHHAPQIHVHSHAKGHTVHIMHHDGSHEKHEHAAGDADGIAQHIHANIGGDQSNDLLDQDGLTDQLGDEPSV